MSAYMATILITGGTTGLGYQCALHLAKQYPNYQIVIASRSNTDSASSKINNSTGRTSLEYLALDLADLKSVRSFASIFQSKGYPPIQALLLNAGLQFPDGVTYSQDGYESTFTINHLGNALVFHLLRPQLAPHARVIVTSSGTHDPAMRSGLPDARYTTAEELAHPTAQSAKNAGRQRYSTSKLCNVLWTYALTRRLEKSDSQITVNAYDPGLMPGTGLAREASPMLRLIWYQVLPPLTPLLRTLGVKVIITPKASAKLLADLAVDEKAAGMSGKYFSMDKEIKSSVDSYREEDQEDLWNWTVQVVAKDEEEKQRFANGI